ncbi:MAG: divL [Rickettsiaceae bacterium]|jgi:signal transduction histidine kinase/PAS domain-containing protein|nr:divL [Rickettsiaceae bacterium]
MLELYTTISLIILATIAVLFFVKWRLDDRTIEILQKKIQLHEIINSASIGGYYYCDSKGNEEFSLNLIKILGLQSRIKNFLQFVKIFNADAKNLTDLLAKLQSGERENFIINCKCKIDEQVKHIQCFGNRVDTDSGDISGAIIWFYDVSEYTEEIKKLTSHYNNVKNEAKDYIDIFNALPIPVWLRNSDFTIHHCNLMYSQMVNANDVNISEGAIPDLDENLRQMSQMAFKNKRVLHMKKHMVVNGERRFFDISESAVTGGDGIIGFASDITNQENIEKELGRHISAQADLLESSSSAMAIYGADTKLRFYNNAFVKLWGLNEKFLNSKPTYLEVLEALREKRKLPEQADFKKFRNEQMQLFTDLFTTHDEFFYLPDGKALRVIVIPHALGGLLFSYEDMTDRFAMETLYNTLIAVQRETLDNLREGVAVFGRDGILKLYNPMYAMMWPDELPLLDSSPHSDALLEKSKHLFKYTGNWEEFKHDWMERPHTRKPVIKRIERTDGKFIEKLVVTLPDGDFLFSYEDITDSILAEKTLRERNEALEAADKLKTEFLANVSYELRTPLTSIMGFSEVLAEKHFGPLNKQQVEYVTGIHDSSSQLMVLINDILDLASIEAGYMVLDVRNFDVYTGLYSVMEATRERCKYAGIKLSMQCDKNIGEMMGDEKRIKQVLFNIIDNSIKFTDRGGNIVIGAETHGKSEIAIWVEDSGIGINNNEKGKVFDRFFKSSAAFVMKKTGTGLGLAVVKNIVELHGGKVELESSEGEGTKITCYFKRKNLKLLR